MSSRLNYKRLFMVFGLVPIIFGVLVFYFTKNGLSFSYFVSNDKKIASTTEEVIQSLGRLMVLPENETPAIATIYNVEKLKNQDFFLYAENGYKVIIYQNNRKAILYNPLEDRIIEVSSINLTTSVNEIDKSGKNK